ncbi:hypothetical protein [Sphingomonas oryzagri]
MADGSTPKPPQRYRRRYEHQSSRHECRDRRIDPGFPFGRRPFAGTHFTLKSGERVAVQRVDIEAEAGIVRHPRQRLGYAQVTPTAFDKQRDRGKLTIDGGTTTYSVTRNPRPTRRSSEFARNVNA